MIIPINLNPEPDTSDLGCSFPPHIVKLGTSELVILEMQGSFHVEGLGEGDDTKGRMVAKLMIGEVSTCPFLARKSLRGVRLTRLTIQDNKPSLLVGHNLLEGKIVTLSKPLAVLRKRSPMKSGAVAQVNAQDDIEDMDEEGARKINDFGESVEDGTGLEYDMVALVTKKLLFSKRPMPVVKLVGSQT